MVPNQWSILLNIEWQCGIQWFVPATSVFLRNFFNWNFSAAAKRRLKKFQEFSPRSGEKNSRFFFKNFAAKRQKKIKIFVFQTFSTRKFNHFEQISIFLKFSSIFNRFLYGNLHFFFEKSKIFEISIGFSIIFSRFFAVKRRKKIQEFFSRIFAPERRKNFKIFFKNFQEFWNP